MNTSNDTLPDFLKPITTEPAPSPAKRKRGRPKKEKTLTCIETPFTLSLIEWRNRTGLSDQGMATYLGVPVVTFQQWIRGQRTPNSSALRLVEVLQTVETFAPDLARSLKPGSPGATGPTEAP